VVWLVAVSSGPGIYNELNDLLYSWPGQSLLFALTFSLFFHLCNGIRHLCWDAGYGFELRTIYASGWIVLIASILLTLTIWAAALIFVGGNA
jgi:succinate dehydrogenase / fumarate reductase cytochrome b subunit